MTGQSLREVRVALGLTQSELAERWGVRRATISDWERGAHDVPEWVRDALDGVAATTRSER